MASLIDIESESQFHSTVKDALPTTLLVLYFKADWAEPCAQMKNILSTLASTYPDDKSISFLSIDAEALPDISESFDVASVPYIVIHRDNQTLETVSGSDANKVRAAVERHATSSSSDNKKSVPPPLEATPQGISKNDETPTTKTKDLSQYAPNASDPATAPEYSSTKESKEELNTRLGNLVKAAPVMLFMKGTPSAPQCGFSRQLVAILRENNVKYGFFNILADDDVRQGLKEYADWPTFPQLWTNGELVGGLDIVKEEMESDKDFFKAFSVSKSQEQDTTTSVKAG